MNHTIEMSLAECRICGTPVSIATRIWDNLSANGGSVTHEKNGIAPLATMPEATR